MGEAVSAINTIYSSSKLVKRLVEVLLSSSVRVRYCNLGLLNDFFFFLVMMVVHYSSLRGPDGKIGAKPLGYWQLGHK